MQPLLGVREGRRDTRPIARTNHLWSWPEFKRPEFLAMSTAAKKTTACAAYLKCIAALHEQAVPAVGNVSKVE